MQRRRIPSGRVFGRGQEGEGGYRESPSALHVDMMGQTESVKWWVFALRFLGVAVVSLALMGLLLKPYTHLLRWVVGAALNWFATFGITSSAVEGDWFKVTLSFTVNESIKTMPAGFVAMNLPAFVALVGATPGIGVRRTVRSLAVGCGVFFVWHVVQLSVLLVAGVTMNLASPTGVARFLATISVVLPFALWLVLARPPFIVEYFRGMGGEDGEQS